MNLPNWPTYDIEEIESVSKILKSGRVNYKTGQVGKEFERKFASFCGCKYAVAVANGSLALSAAYSSLKLSPGDEFITTPRTFIATSSTAVLNGLIPIFADVDINTGNITAKSIEPLITEKTKAICVVHIAGWPADMDEICSLALKYNIKIIEDCSQAHGAKINGKSVGSFGDVSTWSFCQDKIISTGGEGGMLTTNSKEIYDFVLSYIDHGKTQESIKRNKSTKGYKWVHDRFGNNFRLTEMQSQIGIIQLKKISKWIKIRERNSYILYKKISGLNLVRIPFPKKNIQHAWYKFYFYLNTEFISSKWNRDRIIQEINKKNMPAFHGGCSEIYLENCFRNKGLGPNKRLNVAKELGDTSIMLLVHPTIDEENMLIYANIVYEILSKALD